MDPHHPGESRCEDLAAADLIIPYTLGLLDEGQRTAFESHILSCDSCYSALLAVERTAELLKRFLDSHPPGFLKTLGRKKRGGKFSLKGLLGREIPVLAALGGGLLTW